MKACALLWCLWDVYSSGVSEFEVSRFVAGVTRNSCDDRYDWNGK